MTSATEPLIEVTWRPPMLASERLLLRGWEAADAEAVFAYASDAAVTPYMFWERHQTLADSHAFLDMTAGDYARGELTYALCLRSAPRTAIGGVGVYWKSKDHRVMELGYVLAKQHWGNGYVPEAGRLLIRYAFDSTSVHRIYAPIFAENARSRRAAAKMGLTFEGVLRSSLELRGRRWDEAVYAILRGDAQSAAKQ